MNKLCVLPWTHMATLTNGDVKLCCIAKNDSSHNLNKENIVSIWNSDYYKSVRKAMLNGEQIKTCETCYKEEDMGITSHRMYVEKSYENKKVLKQIEKLIDSTKPDGSISITPPTLDLRLGNTCNLECIMCGPGESSKWVKRSHYLADNLKTDIKKHWIYVAKQTEQKFEWYKTEEFWKSLKDIAPTLMHITFGGGEPLYIKEHKQIIKYLVDNGFASNIEMLYHTNGTIYDEDIVDLWSNFKSIKVMLSIDGHGEVNDIIRRPSQWNLIERNLKLYDSTKENITVSINLTVQLLNVDNLVTFSSWLLEQNFKKIGKKTDGGVFFASLLHYPDYLSVQILPVDLKNKITKDILNFVSLHPTNSGVARLKDIVEFMNNKDKSDLLYQTLDYLENNDCSASAFLPQLRKSIQQ